MSDVLGFRTRVAIALPAINTIAQPEFEAMRPRGVTNHVGRIAIRDRLIKNDDDLLKLVSETRAAMDEAIGTLMSCQPDHLIIGASAVTFWDGLEGSRELQERLTKRAGVDVTLCAEACHAALRKFGTVKRLGIITPYPAIGDTQARKFFADCGYEILAVKGLRCGSPAQAAHVTEKELRDALDQLDDPMIEAIVQFGANLAMARVAAKAEFWMDIPVIAVNTATYWRALRRAGIDDKVFGFGALLEDF